MDWDYTDTTLTAGEPLTVLGAELAEVFFEDSKHRRSDGACAAPVALSAALTTAADLFRSRSVDVGADLSSPKNAVDVLRAANVLADVDEHVASGSFSAGVEFLVERAGRVLRVVPGAGSPTPALPLTDTRRAAFCRALGLKERELPVSCSFVAVVAYPLRLVLGAHEVGGHCSMSRAHRRAMIDAGRLLELAACRLLGAGFSVTSQLHFYDDELHAALGLDGVSELVVGVLLTHVEEGTP